jgi:ribosomal protein S18 acetylase RimI-like enzyme
MSAADAVVLRPMAAADIPAVVKLQADYLKGSVVSELGGGFLTAFHRAALDHPCTVTCVAADSAGAIVGLLSGSTDVHAFNAHVKPRVLLPLVTALVSPRGWRYTPMFARSLFEKEPQPAIPAELLLLVVDPRVRRRGIAQRLVAELERSFGTCGIERYRVAVRSQLGVARAFYLAMGFTMEQELKVLGAPMTYLTKAVRQ